MDTQLDLFAKKTNTVAVTGKRDGNKRIKYTRDDNGQEIDPFNYGHMLRALEPKKEEFGKSDWVGFVFISVEE